ncbi:MAG: phosphomethylpyrimidine synthase ThiC, partial [Hyphomicrobiales bacterium]|nr:phosphomethylpyrimidine synthase ThiC [Hyphomicrobiales bacterium]
MNYQHKPDALIPESVTIGAMPGSRKVYYTPQNHPDVHVPYRELTLTDPLEPELRIYDPTGPYTDPDYIVDLSNGLPRIRDPWIARRDIESYTGRIIQAVDNGNVPGDKLVPPCPAVTEPRAARDGQLITQYEFARAGIVTEEMVYVAHRENLCREKALADAAANITNGNSWGAAIPEFVTPE